MILRYYGDENVYWEVTPEKVFVKIMRKTTLSRHSKDPAFQEPAIEAAAMQFLSTGRVQKHVMSVLDIFQDEEYFCCSCGMPHLAIYLN